MRARDVRALVFCAVTTLLLLGGSYLLFQSALISLALAVGWLAFILTRPRMQRVIRRLRGEPDWNGYFRND